MLIFDEVVTGFRVSKGGAQAHYGVTPDLTSLAKILAGGLPGGCVTGRTDILELLDFDVAAEKGFEKIGHQGTYNANPMSATAGITALGIINAGDANDAANASGAKLRRLCNEVIAEEGLPWACYGEFSGFYFFLNPQGLPVDPLNFDAPRDRPRRAHRQDAARRKTAPRVARQRRRHLRQARRHDVGGPHRHRPCRHRRGPARRHPPDARRTRLQVPLTSQTKRPA